MNAQSIMWNVHLCAASELVCVLQALLQEKKCVHTHTHSLRSGTQRRNTITSIPETRLISSAFHPNPKLLRICHQCGCLCQTKRGFFLLPAASCNSSHMRSTFSTVLYCRLEQTAQGPGLLTCPCIRFLQHYHTTAVCASLYIFPAGVLHTPGH